MMALEDKATVLDTLWDIVMDTQKREHVDSRHGGEGPKTWK